MNFELDHTIAAIATPLGEGGLAVVRLSGPDAFAVADKSFVPIGQSSLKPSAAPTHTIQYGKIVHNGQFVDEVILAVLRAPRTYTREHTVEITCHGGLLPAKLVLDTLLENGARLALPGEFTKRAFLNGRLDLAQAEAVLDLIQAKSESGLQLAWEQLSGRLSGAYAAIRERLLSVTAYVEAFIDFPEEDIPERAQTELEQDIATLIAEIAALCVTFAQGKVYRESMRTAIIGKPNVGKSSLLNLLAGTERAIVTPVPGTTRDVLEETLVVSGVPLVVWDTAGLRNTTDEVERIGVERARAGVREAELVLAVFDA